MTSPQRIDWSGQGTKLAIQLQLKSVDGRLSTLQFDGPWRCSASSTRDRRRAGRPTVANGCIRRTSGPSGWSGRR
ncbi:hypothetical protein Bsp3421_002297 [Burkholderia sp. FERM BP-3421]|nr:hypothetical protein [Burkholderia sp. FERM BP-3421]WDD92299.1 hypothetical protein Bsp3421_002297 [Burkholderia sp. FERM BP-3421]